MTLNKDPFDYISPYHVSLCSSLGEKLLTPSGSGTLAKFSIPSDTGKKTVYGILTATHVLENTELVTHKKFGGLWIGAVRLRNRLGDIHSANHLINSLFCDMDNRRLRYLQQNHKGKGPSSERDCTFICLGVGEQLLSTDFFKNSKFYDLDITSKLHLPKKHSIPIAFFRGACPDDEIISNTINSGIHVVVGGELKTHPKSKILYHKLPNISRQTMRGASGAGIWIFSQTEQGIEHQLIGTIVEETNDYSKIIALDISYIQGDLLPKLKEHYLNGKQNFN